GLMLLTGRPGGPPLAPDGPVLSRLQSVCDGAGRSPRPLDGIELPRVLSGRARAAQFVRQGEVSANGSCHLIRAADGWVALNLARPSDHEALSALVSVELPAAGGESAVLAAAIREMARLTSAELVAQAELLALPLSALPPRTPPEASAVGRPAVRVTPRGSSAPEALGPDGAGSLAGLTVVNLASLWAGPLTARLLGASGASVTSIQSTARPDPSRASQPEFHGWLHAGQAERRFDFSAPADRAELAALISAADVVIEGSRPRALSQFGLGPRELAPRVGQVWLSITGYGRDSGRVAFGDDAAVAGGLVAWDERGPVFCGDALADPITGVFGYRAVLDALAAGGGQLIDLSMSAAAAEIARPDRAGSAGCREHDVRFAPATGRWRAHCGDRVVDVAEPHALRPGGGQRPAMEPNSQLLR
ncbi:MAG: hypothetical protein JWO63_1960, partial [Frankiales bacterium]|nr:hypothetical protein [Frankiales bacterium]